MGAETARTLIRKRTVCLTAFVLLSAVFLIIQSADDRLTFIRGSDSATYVLLAKSIAEGHGYSNINIPGSPPHTQYPPLFPLILSAPFHIFGYNFFWMRFVVIVSGVMAACLVKAVFAKKEGGNVGALIALLTITNSSFIFFTGEILTEIPYTFIIFLGLNAASEPRAATFRRAFLISAIIWAAYMTRMIGVAFYAAVIAAMFLGQDAKDAGDAKALRRAAVFIAIAGIMPLIAWTIRGMAFSDGASAYHSTFVQADYYSSDKGFVNFGGMAARVFENLSYYRESALLMLLGPGVKKFIPQQLGAVMQWTVSAVILLGAFGELYGKRGAAEFYFVFYLALLAIWPVYGLGDAHRYSVPLIPFLYFYFGKGAAFAAGLRRPFPWAAAIPFLVLLPINLFSIKDRLWPYEAAARADAALVKLAGSYGKRVEAPAPGAFALDWFERNLPCYTHYMEGAFFLRSEMAQGEVIAARKPEVVALITGGRAVRFPFTNDHSAMHRFVEEGGVDYLLLDSCYPESKDFLLPYIVSRPERFKPLPFGKKDTAIFKQAAD